MIARLERAPRGSINLEVVRKDATQREACLLTYETGNICSIEFASSFCSGIAFSGRDLFDALVGLRLHLEKDGWYLLCAGSRLNAYPSGMSRDMSKGRRLSLLFLGTPARREDKADIFDPAEIEDVSDVETQKAYFERWLKSL